MPVFFAARHFLGNSVLDEHTVYQTTGLFLAKWITNQSTATRIGRIQNLALTL
jgi:hypothetical protein